MLCNVLYTNVQHQEEKRYFELIGSKSIRGNSSCRKNGLLSSALYKFSLDSLNINTTSSFYLVYMIKLGTLENEVTADVEWRHHAYTHTAKKRRFLSIE